jgi:hypothetical protein
VGNLLDAIVRQAIHGLAPADDSGTSTPDGGYSNWGGSSSGGGGGGGLGRQGSFEYQSGSSLQQQASH